MRGEPGEGEVPSAVRVATLSDTGTERPNNEDSCGVHVESAADVLLVLADGVGGEAGGEVASQMAVEAVVRTYRESNPALGPSKRLYRAAQQANIEVYDRAQIVTELRRMSTTLTAVAVVGNSAFAAHVGDSRLYLVREGEIIQKTKDHTVAAGRRLSPGGAHGERYPLERSMLTRSVGRELIAAVDRIEFPVTSGDALIVCSDGLYNVLHDEDLRVALGDHDAEAACASLIAAANERGTPDNLTVGVVRVVTAPALEPPGGWRGLLSRFLNRQ